MLEFIVACAVGAVFIFIACNGLDGLYEYVRKRWK